jgi:hypothetical protein
LIPQDLSTRWISVLVAFSKIACRSVTSLARAARLAAVAIVKPCS